MGVILVHLGWLPVDPALPWQGWVVLGLILINGGFMAYDGGRAILVGDYITPKKGPRAGMLGPWSVLVQAVGIPPRSIGMKAVFLVYGLAYTASGVALLAGVEGATMGVAILAVLGLWYLPFGTLINLIVLALLTGMAS